MIRDYFERKKIWLSSSPGHIGLAFIVLLVTTLCGVGGFVFAGVLFMLSIAVFRSLEINKLLPFSKKERKTRFLTEVMLDLLCLSVPLLINIAFIVIRYRKLELFSHPVYVAVCFISYIIVLAHFSINDIFWKAAEDSRNLEKCLADASFFSMFIYGALQVLPKIIVSYVVGLGIEFAWAQWKGEEIQEGFLVSGIIIPLIIPVGCPLWALAIAVAFAVVIGKEIFGGTGMNIFNVALITRAFLFFSYPTKMSGDAVWVANDTIFGLGNTLPDTFTCATPLGQIAQGAAVNSNLCDMITGLIPGSIGETSVIAIAIGAVLLLATGIASWRTMLSVFVGGAVTAYIFQALGMTPISWYEHLVLGGFCFGAVFMATDPVTSARTQCGQFWYGAIIGIMAVIIRVMNPGYPEGMMLAILFMNMFAPLIDYCVVQKNISKRMKRLTNK